MATYDEIQHERKLIESELAKSEEKLNQEQNKAHPDARKLDICQKTIDLWKLQLQKNAARRVD